MTKLLAAASALIFLSTSAQAADPTQAQFEYDGETISYSLEWIGAAQHLLGRNQSTGDNFDLTIRNGRVTGTYGAFSVSFHTSDAVELLAKR